MNKKIIFYYFLIALIVIISITDSSYAALTAKFDVDKTLAFWTPERIKSAKPLIDDPRINERVTHSDRRGKFLKKMTNRVPLHEKLYYAFVPPHDFFLHAQIKQISKNI
jgi:hypothetical protein